MLRVLLTMKVVSLLKQLVFPQADQENDKYALVLKRAVNSPKEMELYGEIRYKSSLYSIGTVINLMKKRQVLIELHLDR